jgi:protein TonB
MARPSPAPEATQPTPTPIETVAPEPATETAVPVADATPPPSSAATGTPSVASAPVAAAPVAAAPAPRIELPSASAAYLNNPPPAYPALSRRLGEQGRVLLRVRIEPDGTASAAEIRTSSGYERLDQAALQAVLSWRYVPGKRNGVPEAMWFLIPIQFELR